MDKINSMEIDLLYELEDNLVHGMREFYKIKSSLSNNEIVTEEVNDAGLTYHINKENPFTIVYSQDGNKFSMEIEYIDEEETINLISSTIEPCDANDSIYKFIDDDKYTIYTMINFEICDLCIVKDIIRTLKELVK